jgi:hypothetical protein
LEKLEKLFKTKRAARRFRFHYSTVSEYFEAVKKEMQASTKLQWPTFRGDFFPYNGIHPGSYWSGYYTSRPNFKKLIRDFTSISSSLNNLLGFQTLVNRTLTAPGASTTVTGFNRNKMNEFSQKIGELTHHDTITGTSVRAVII